MNSCLLRKNKKTNTFLISYISFFFILIIAYYIFVYKYFKYSNFNNNFNFIKFLINFLIFLLVSFLIPKNKFTITIFCFHIQFFIIFVPLLVFNIFNVSSFIFLLTITVSFLMQILFYELFTNSSNNKSLNINKKCHYYFNIKKEKIFISLGLIFSFFILFLSIFLIRIPTIKAFDLGLTYILRAENNSILFLDYASTWTTKIIIPFFIVYTLYRKKYFLFSIFLLMQILFFMIYINKTTLFICFFIIIIFLLIKNKLFFKCFSSLLTIGVLICLLFNFLIDFIYPASLFIRRFLFLPAQIKFAYYDFFSQNQFLYFSEGQIGNLFNLEYPYDIPSVKLIASKIFNKESNFNTGYWGDAYAQLGLPGIFILSAILIILLCILEKMSNNIPKEIKIPAIAFSFLSLNDGALLTNILTGGMFIFFILFYFSSKIIKINNINTYPKENTNE